MFSNKTLLITGGTGSFGQKMLRYFIENTNIQQIRIFSRDEEKQNRMRGIFKDDRIKYYIGDVRNFDSVNDATKCVDLIFHAAALKQVPSCEFYPMEAVATNVIGANNLLKAACENKVKNVVVLSTDKAVKPVNAMGMTKALMEKIMIAKSQTIDSKESVLCATRYGNVMASRGSVIPLFVKQCKQNVPITVTDPDMTRFLMSLEESIKLVLFAFENANNGDVFVQKAPASTIMDLALAIKEIFNAKNDIKIIGTRHGEKAHEILVGCEEIVKAENLGSFYRIPADTRTLNYDIFFVDGNKKVSSVEEYTSANTTRLDVDGVIKKLLDLDYIQTELKTKEYVGVAK
ncbi:MAG: polysaccharide biosynthesis protein [Holosporaceae bacterium]|jgi:UDP-glucose 4-epimerase|nr:polysaccharide biosynthesis protein [Holosporaceae bacterium]